MPWSDSCQSGPAASIHTWIARWNDEPQPFVWHKTADEILESLAAHCQRISDSGH